VNAKLEGSILTLTIPIDVTGRESKSGKSTIHFTTAGFKNVDGTALRVGINVIS
jgi:hypothetical protein